MKSNIRTFLFCFIFVIYCGTMGYSQRISIKGNNFVVNDKPIFLVGANTPWDSWNDFGGNYNPQFWEDEFSRMQKVGINSSRIWISCDNMGQPHIDMLGVVQKPSTEFWAHMDDMMQKAEKYGIYIMATVTSFDHFDEEKANYQQWRSMLHCSQQIQAYIDVFLLPLIARYESNPYFFSVDICNEPEWIHEHKKQGAIDWPQLQLFAGMCAAAVHRTQSSVLVSIGSAAVKWGSNKYEGNKWSDQALQVITGDSLAYMDYWHIHYYEWINKHFSNPFTMSPSDYMLNDRPCVIGETPGLNTIYGFPITYEEIYEKPYELGYAGVYPWTSNGAGKGDFGNLNTFGVGATAFVTKYSELIPKQTSNLKK
ncbi:MAG: hypothetical protein BWY22_01613 [Bacteroidetes bacterium ADurb.Bin217]|nr:MAG: hypothetical protein BWY22_01613 [Bacteroidetes bacterium ADurb.Bin217]